MNVETLDRVCAALPHSRMVVQWGGAQVWKIEEKVFAIAWTRGSQHDPCPITLKVDATASEFLLSEEGVEIAPYFRSTRWLRFLPACTLSDDELTAYIKRSRDIVISGLPKKVQAALTS